MDADEPGDQRRRVVDEVCWFDTRDDDDDADDDDDDADEIERERWWWFTRDEVVRKDASR